MAFILNIASILDAWGKLTILGGSLTNIFQLFTVNIQDGGGSDLGALVAALGPLVGALSGVSSNIHFSTFHAINLKFYI